MSAINGEDSRETVASRKQAAAEMRKARKEARNPRNRLLSDTSDEMPKGILKNCRIPTKRSVSECVDDLSQIMAELDVNIHDLPRATDKFCIHHQYLDEEDEEDYESKNNDSQDTGEDDDDSREVNDADEDENGNNNNKNKKTNLKKCDCNVKYGGDISTDDISNEKPKKSVRFDEQVYETVFFASKVYDRRFVRYHLSTRHHPPPQNKSKKNRQRSSKSESSKDEYNCGSISSLKSDNSNNGCKLSKSQRARQSKKDKKRRLQKKDEVTDTSSDDQGYCSSLHSFSD